MEGYLDWTGADDKDREIHNLRAEITQLRAELEQALHADGMYRRKNHALTDELKQERELTDRLAGLLDKAIDGIWVHSSHYATSKDAIQDARTRRNK